MTGDDGETAESAASRSLRRYSRAEIEEWLTARAEECDPTSVLVELVFVGQAWIDGCAEPTDDGTHRFDVPLQDLRRADGEWAVHETTTGYHVDDRFQHHQRAPPAVTKWQGPFTIVVGGYRVLDEEESSAATPTPERTTVEQHGHIDEVHVEGRPDGAIAIDYAEHVEENPRVLVTVGSEEAVSVAHEEGDRTKLAIEPVDTPRQEGTDG